MTLEALAVKVIEAAESAGVDFMVVGAIAAGAYGVPRSTRDVDLLVSIRREDAVSAVIARLDPIVEFNSQIVFDTLTWGRRHVGQTRSEPPFEVELFEMFDDPFVRSRPTTAPGKTSSASTCYEYDNERPRRRIDCPRAPRGPNAD